MRSHLEVAHGELADRERELERIVAELQAKVAQLQTQVLTGSSGGGGVWNSTEGAVMVRVTVTCDVRVGSAPGQAGRGYYQTFDGTNYADDTAAGLQTIFNNNDKTFVGGASSWTPCLRIFGLLWLPSPASCTLIV